MKIRIDKNEIRGYSRTPVYLTSLYAVSYTHLTLPTIA